MHIWKYNISFVKAKYIFNWRLLWHFLIASFIIGSVFWGIKDESIKDLIEWMWINPIGKHIESSLAGIIFFTIGLVLIFCIVVYLKKEIALFYLSIVTISFFFRTKEFWNLPNIWIGFIPFSLPAISIILKIIKVEMAAKNSTLISNIPDSFKRTNFAKSIVKDIKSIDLKNLTGSYNYGLIGEWGSGKTYLMNMIYFEMKKDDLFIATLYKPWETPKEDQFFKEIIAGLKNQTHHDDNEIIVSLNNYLLNLQANSQDFITSTIASFLLWLTGKRASLSQLKNEIAELLQSKKKRLIVFLDDLDRLQENEIREVLRLLRNTFDIPSLFFIVGFDREYLRRTLKFDNQNNKNFDRYIAKFFQTKVNIPKIKKQDLDEKYFVDLKLFGIHLDITKNQFFEKIGDIILDLIQTPTDYENIFNSFRMVYNNLKDECDWFTLIQLEIIRHKEYELYHYLSKLNQNGLKFNDELINSKEVEQNNYIKTKKEIISQIIKSSDFGTFKITDSFYYFKYFTLVNHDNEIGFRAFKVVFDTSDVEILKNQIVQWIEEGKNDDLIRKTDLYLKTCDLNKSPEYLISIDLNLEKGVNKSIVNQSIISYINRIFNELGKEKGFEYIKELKKLIPEDRIVEMFEFYFFTEKLDQFKTEIFNLFDKIIESESISINQTLYYFFNKLYSFLHGSFIHYFITKKSISKISEQEIETISEIIDHKLLDFAKNSIKSFLLNFIMTNPGFSNTPHFGFYNSFVPNLLSLKECMNLLNQLPKDESIIELIDFIEKFQDQTLKSIFPWIPYEWRWNKIFNT